MALGGMGGPQDLTGLTSVKTFPVMADDTYSTYEAKARFSEVLRLVRNGRTVTVTYRGEPVAEIRPIEKKEGTSARIQRLADRGVIITSTREERRDLRPVERRPGALRRFLEEREEG